MRLQLSATEAKRFKHSVKRETWLISVTLVQEKREGKSDESNE